MKTSQGFAIFLAVLMVQGAVAANGNDGKKGYSNDQCRECHEEMAADHSASVHGDIPCLECHILAMAEDHQQVAQTDCRPCHGSHDESVTHDPHSRVACNACHVKGGIPGMDPESGTIIFSGMFRPGDVLPPHQAITSPPDKACTDCHFKGNAVGASSMVLPAKGILCLPCHVAAVSVGDTTTRVFFFLFLVGMTGLGRVWFSGSTKKRALWTGEKTKVKTPFKPNALFFARSFRLLKLFFWEVVLLQRLFQRSKARWIIHSLIFFPFLFRLGYGLAVHLFSIYLPDGSITSALVDKNHALPALFFDVTGLMLFAGAMAAMVRKGIDPGGTIASLPEPGPGMPAMIGLIVVAGFILEGWRIAMTGWPDGSGWAFLGYGISLLFKGMTGLTDMYGYIWVAHGILAGVFMALIPFTRMSHIITAPIVLIINARSREQDCFGK